MEGYRVVKRRTCTPGEARVKKARVELRKRLSELVDYMDTLDQSIWDELKLASIYNDNLDAIQHLKYNSSVWEDINEESDKGIKKDI